MTVSKASDFRANFDAMVKGFELKVPGFGGAPLTLRVRAISSFEVAKMRDVQNLVDNDMLPAKKDKGDEYDKKVAAMEESSDKILARVILEPSYADIKDFLIMEQKTFIAEQCIISDITATDLAVLEEIKKK